MVPHIGVEVWCGFRGWLGRGIAAGENLMQNT